MAIRVASRDLRNNTADLLRRVDAGEQIVITKRGDPVASLVPFQQPRRRWLPRAELVRRLGAVMQLEPDRIEYVLRAFT